MAEETTMGVNSEWCRTLTFMDKLSGSAVFSCMLLESIFLHRLIAAAFKGEPKMIYYYITAGAVALVPVAAWTIIEALYDNINCWSVNVNSYSYIIDGPRIATLVVNALLMMDIVRVLCTKLKRVNTAKSGQIRPTWAYSDHRHTATSLVPSESVTKPRVSNAHPYDDVLAGESKPRNSIRLGIYGNNPFLNQDPNSTGEHRSISLKGDNSPGLFSDDGPKSPTKRTSVTFSTDVFINIPLSPSKRNSVTFSGNCFPVTPPSPEGRSTTPFLKSSLKHDGLSKRPSYIEGARQRKISSVNEENIYEVIAEDESNKYTPKPREKYRDSDEEAIVFDEGFEGTIPQDFDIQKAEQNVLNVEHTISSETLTPPRLSNGIRKRSTGNASDEETNA
ncbi:hypothetical protein C0J52_04443 [Blattella germanica]|nr:hypothetical protein C0J52_04443 [Blattella germanica]